MEVVIEESIWPGINPDASSNLKQMHLEGKVRKA